LEKRPSQVGIISRARKTAEKIESSIWLSTRKRKHKHSIHAAEKNRYLYFI